MSADFLMEFTDNEYNGEKQIRELLLQKQKFTLDVADDSFRRKCEDRLFTQRRCAGATLRKGPQPIQLGSGISRGLLMI